MPKNNTPKPTATELQIARRNLNYIDVRLQELKVLRVKYAKLQKETKQKLLAAFVAGFDYANDSTGKEPDEIKWINENSN